MKTVRPPLLLCLVALVLTEACASAKMQVPTLAPRYQQPKTALRVAVLPLGDRREDINEPRSFWYFVPFIPWSTADYSRRDESYAQASDREHFSRQVAQALADTLDRSGLFAEVQALESPAQLAAAKADLVVSGELLSSRRQELRTFYGLSVAGMALWLLGLPMGYDRINWELDLRLTDPSGATIHRRIHTAHALKRWHGLYWGDNAFPHAEAELLQRTFATVVAQLDHALEDEPALMALTTRTLKPAAVDTETITVRAPIKQLLVMPAGEMSPAERAFLDLLGAELQRRATGKVLGLADINTLLAHERMRDMMGCTDVACMSELAGALNADAVVTLSFARLGTEQTVTVKLVDPSDTQVLTRTVWAAPGSDPSAFMTKLSDIAEDALAPLMPSGVAP